MIIEENRGDKTKFSLTLLGSLARSENEIDKEINRRKA